MARYTGPVCRLCRREGAKLYLKGARCYASEKCAFDRRPYPPGQHGKGRIKVSEYGKRLREKQKVRRVYGLLERQFAKFFVEASRKKGVTGEVLLQLLESRLDNVAFRMGFASTRADARQLVRHNHVTVNGHRVNIPSFLVQPGSRVILETSIRQSPRIVEAQAMAKSRDRASWIEMAEDGFGGVYKAAPTRTELETVQPVEMSEQLVVEFYSR